MKKPPRQRTHLFIHFQMCAWAFAIFSGCLVYLSASLGHYGEEERAEYRKIIHADEEGDSLPAYTSQQHRLGLQKDLFLSESGQKLRFRVRSEEAELAFERREGSTEFVERMSGVTGSMQERLYFESGGKPMQRAVSLIADEASYHYKSDHFFAKNVVVSQYIADGHFFEEAPPLKILMKGAADQGDYDGKKITLSGNAVIEHELGTVSAQKISSRLVPDEKETECGLVRMSGQVCVRFKEGGVLTCGQAVVNYAARSGIFSGNSEQEEAVYTEHWREKNSSREVPVSLAAKQMTVFLADKEDKIDKIIAEDGVKIHDDRHTVSARSLIWDEARGVLTLKEGVEVELQGIGTLQTPGDLNVFQQIIDGKRQLGGMEADAGTILTYHDEETNQPHILTCYGSTKVDHQKMEVRLYSPINGDGTIAEDKQVFFQDAKGEIYANKVFLQYGMIDRKAVLVKVILAGNVRMFNQPAGMDGEKANQYALASRVDFFPSTNEMIFKGGLGERVLFFDKANKLEVSAPLLKIKRDQSTKKESFQGIGDVRFRFIEHELEQLRQKFSLEKETVGVP